MFSSVFIYILIILFGLTVGSFLNVLILRFDDLKSIVNTRSRCPHCKKQIAWYDLFPFLSYIFLAGRCRNCKKTISVQYPIVEAATAAVFACIYYHFSFSWESLILAIVFSLLITIGVYDLLHFEIPDILTYLTILFAIGYIKLNLWQSGELFSFNAWLPYIYGLLIGGGFFALLVIVSKQKWMGWGDVILAAFMGLFLGYPNIILALFLAFFIGSLASLVLIALKTKKMKDAVPFGPFLVLATFITFFWGQKIIDLYFSSLGL